MRPHCLKQASIAKHMNTSILFSFDLCVDVCACVQKKNNKKRRVSVEKK